MEHPLLQKFVFLCGPASARDFFQIKAPASGLRRRSKRPLLVKRDGRLGVDDLSVEVTLINEVTRTIELLKWLRG